MHFKQKFRTAQGQANKHKRPCLLLKPPIELLLKEGLSAQFPSSSGLLSAELAQLSPEKLRR